MGMVRMKDDEITKEDSIRAMKSLIKRCDDSIKANGITGHVFMPQIKSYHPFMYKDNNRNVATKAISLKQRLEKEIKRLEG